MRMDWDTLSPDAWYGIYTQIPKTNIIQSYAYAKAMRDVHYQMTRFGVIYNDQDQVIGLTQIQEIRFLGVIHKVFLDRGPIWCIGQDTDQNHHDFWMYINQCFPQRLGRRRRFIPEYSGQDMSLVPETMMKKKAEGYQTIWLDLRPDIDVLHQNLHKKWRNMLKRAGEENLYIEMDDHGIALEYLLAQYEQDRREKQYAGASAKFIRALERHKSEHEYSLIYAASVAEDKPPCAMVYVFVHGKSATYQIGWSDKTGREKRAHYVLLWRVIQDLKEKQINWFDLGGIDETHAEGVTRFKKGMGGAPMKTIGIFS